MEQVNAGDILLIQGSIPKEVIMLHQGSVELVSAPNEYIGLDQQLILSHSKKLLTIKEPGIILGCHAFNKGEICNRSLRALTPCQIDRYPLPKEGFGGIISSAPENAGFMLKQMFNRINSVAAVDSKYAKLYQYVCTISDNLALMYKELNGSGAPPALEDKANAFYNGFSSTKGRFPEFFSGQFLLTDNSRYISRRYTLAGESVENILKKDVVMLSKNTLSLDKQMLGAMLKANPSIGINMCKTFTEIFDSILFRLNAATDSITKELHGFLDDENSWADYLVNIDGFDQWKNTGRLTKDFVKNLLSILAKLNSIYTEITDTKLNDAFHGVKMIHEYYTNGPKPKQEDELPDFVSPDAPEQPKSISAEVPPDLKNAIRTIFNFTLMDKTFQNKFLKLLNDFKNASSPLSTDSDARRLRSQITKMYWDLYKQAFIRSKAEPKVPKAVRLLLLYGFVDETLLEPEQLAELNQMVIRREPKPSLAILKEIEFLTLVSEGRETPSITEMGLTYEAHLREEEKHKSKKKSNEPADNLDEKTKKIIYEIEHRLTETAAVCSGSRSTAFPILCSAMVKGSLESFLCTKAKVEQAVKLIMNIDFSLFYRETVLKINDEAREIIQEEVTPYFVLLPIFGTRTLLWQELSGTNKRSRARIVIPIFFMGDLEKSLAHTLACFRWELNRSIKGAMWADPIEGGITGEYFDYVNTFKKNAKLSTEAKDKLAERFKALRTNRDRFADDYLMWVFYEKDGIMKLNNVVREMFYKHIPFNKQIREQLINMPAFTHAANRYKNVQNRAAQAYERKFKKYQNESTGHYLPEIEKFMHFLQS